MKQCGAMRCEPKFFLLELFHPRMVPLIGTFQYGKHRSAGGSHQTLNYCFPNRFASGVVAFYLVLGWCRPGGQFPQRHPPDPPDLADGSPAKRK